jgi:hypothetical protein
METYKLLLLIVNSVALGLLVDLFRQLQIRIKTRQKLFFWRVLTLFLILITGSCLVDLLGMLEKNVGYLFRMTITCFFTLSVIRYGHKTYISNEWGNFVGVDVEDAAFFDIKKFVEQLLQDRVIAFSGLRVELISFENNVLKVRSTCVDDVRFPWQFHEGVERIEILAGKWEIMGKTLLKGDRLVVKEYQPHNFKGENGSVCVCVVEFN